MKNLQFILALILIVLFAACKKDEIDNDTGNNNTSNNEEIEAKLEVIYDDTIAPANITFVDKSTGDYTDATLTIDSDYADRHTFSLVDSFTYTVEHAGNTKITLEAYHPYKGTSDKTYAGINLTKPDSGQISKVEMLRAGEVNGEVAVPDNFQIQVEDIYTYTIYTSETLPNVSETNLPVWENVNCKFESLKFDSYYNEFGFIFRQGSDEIYSTSPDGPSSTHFPQVYKYDYYSIGGAVYDVYFKWY